MSDMLINKRFPGTIPITNWNNKISPSEADSRSDPIRNIMQVLRHQRKEAHLNTIESLYIHKEHKAGNDLNDDHTIFPNKIFDNCSVLYLYSFSDKLYPTWWWPQQHWPKHVIEKLYTPDNVAVSWLLYPYRIITLSRSGFTLPLWQSSVTMCSKRACNHNFSRATWIRTHPHIRFL